MIRPPTYIRNNARKALEAIREGSPAMLEVGRRRANQLASGKPVGEVTLKKMSAFVRHKDNASYSGNWKNDRGAVAWLGWGNSIRDGKGIPDASNWAKRQLNNFKGGK